MPHDVAEGHAVEVPVDDALEGVPGGDVRTGGLAPIAEKQAVEAARQLHDHDEMIGTGAIVDVVLGVREILEKHVHVLEHNALVVAAFLLEPQRPAHARVDAIAGDEVMATDVLLRTVRAVHQRCRNAVGDLRDVRALGIPFRAATELLVQVPPDV
ncbi:MAG TPA: hypothetical protein VE175_08335, partial [Woeseiaceae bacterium]|nr:hypothetical protein [Woeseiaceae bacterium]